MEMPITALSPIHVFGDNMRPAQLMLQVYQLLDANDRILDFGPKSIAHIAKIIEGCKTVLWNGPLGAFEIAPFGEGTFALAKQVAGLSKAGKLVSVAGGGDTVAALNAAGVADDFTYVSTAGGAFLEWLEGRELPGVMALLK